MQINNVNLLPQTNSTNSASAGSQVVNDEAMFQAELAEATQRLNNSTTRKTGIMSAEDLAKRNAEIKDASVQMEALLLKMLYGEMWKTVPKDDLFGDDNAMDIYRDMYHDALTRQMAEDGGIGLADYIYDQLTRTQK